MTASGKPVAPFNRRDAARARGWAKRVRDGWKASMGSSSEFDEPGARGQFADNTPLTDEDIPFAWLLPLMLPLMGLMAAGLFA